MSNFSSLQKTPCILDIFVLTQTPLKHFRWLQWVWGAQCVFHWTTVLLCVFASDDDAIQLTVDLVRGVVILSHANNNHALFPLRLRQSFVTKVSRVFGKSGEIIEGWICFLCVRFYVFLFPMALLLWTLETEKSSSNYCRIRRQHTHTHPSPKYAFLSNESGGGT